MESKRTPSNWEDSFPQLTDNKYHLGEHMLSSPLANTDTFVPDTTKFNQNDLADALINSIKYYGTSEEDLTDYEKNILTSAGYNLKNLFTS